MISRGLFLSNVKGSQQRHVRRRIGWNHKSRSCQLPSWGLQIPSDPISSRHKRSTATPATTTLPVSPPRRPQAILSNRLENRWYDTERLFNDKFGFISSFMQNKVQWDPLEDYKLPPNSSFPIKCRQSVPSNSKVVSIFLGIAIVTIAFKFGGRWQVSGHKDPSFFTLIYYVLYVFRELYMLFIGLTCGKHVFV